MTTALTRAACLLTAGLILAAAPAEAQTQENAARTGAIPAPAQLSASQRDAYRSIFAALRAQDWAGAAGRLDGMQSGPLHDLARAMLYTMPGSPRVDLPPILDLLARAPDLPQAADAAARAVAAG